MLSFALKAQSHRLSFFYNRNVKTWDVLIIGGGIIGLSLARELRKQGASVLVVERGEPGREASHAAGGMLVDCGEETALALQPLASASAAMYPEFAHELEDESGTKVDLRSNGTLLFPAPGHATDGIPGVSVLSTPLAELEPALAAEKRAVFFLKERSVCPRALFGAALKAARHRGVDISSGTKVVSIEVTGGRATGVITDKTTYRASKVVNCTGAWAGQFKLFPVPVRPVKGQMVCFAMPQRELLKHVVRSPEIYLIPRSDGRLLAGATVEEAGFDKRTVPETIQHLRRAGDRHVARARGGARAGGLGRTAAGNARQFADPGRDAGAWLFSCDRPLPGRDLAVASDGTDHGAMPWRPKAGSRFGAVFRGKV